jgi:TetR/AcrR family transcriptional regulator, transcriptional repressor for nem operon
MTGRPKIYDEQEVLEKAQHVFWEKGYSATSTEEVLAAMGIGRGSFYLAFEGGKKELFEKAIKQFHRKSFEQFEKIVRESSEPIEMIREFFRNIARNNAHTHKLGCFIGNTIVEMSILDAYLEQEAVLILKELEQLFCTTIKKAQANGQLKTRIDPEILGRHLITLWNGLNITRRMYPDNAKLKPLIDMQLEILQ